MCCRYLSVASLMHFCSFLVDKVQLSVISLQEAQVVRTGNQGLNPTNQIQAQWSRAVVSSIWAFTSSVKWGENNPLQGYWEDKIMRVTCMVWTPTECSMLAALMIIIVAFSDFNDLVTLSQGRSKGKIIWFNNEILLTP